MKKIEIKKGEKYGNLKIIKEISIIGEKRRVFCKCQCGTLKSYFLTDIRLGKTTSCGCYRNKISADRLRKHGMRFTRMYIIWIGMIQRVSNKKNPSYKNYGGRGIKVCDRWRKFENFQKDMVDGYKENLTLDRIDNDGNYQKSNCRWATRSQQNSNTRRSIKNKKL